MYKRFMTLRYLRARLISYVATFVLALGVAVLIIVTAVMGGFHREYMKKIRAHLSDVAVDTRFFFGIKDVDKIEEQIREHPEVVATSPYIENLVVARSFKNYDYSYLKGIDAAKEEQVGSLSEHLLSEREIVEVEFAEFLEFDTDGSSEFKEHAQEAVAQASPARPVVTKVFGATKTGLAPIVVGSELYRVMRLRIGDKINLLSMATSPDRFDPNQFNEEDVRKGKFEVTGVVKTGMSKVDRRALYTTIGGAQVFLGIGTNVTGIAVKLKDYQRAEDVALDLGRSIKRYGYIVKAWSQHDETLMKAVKTERFLIFFVVFFMILLAGLNLTSILTMSVVEKIKDLGILTALGATRAGLMSIFLWQGGLIGVFGTISGAAFGLTFVHYVNEIDQVIIKGLLGRRVFDPTIYYLDRIPNEVTWSMLGWCVLPVLSLGFLLSLYPAYRAARLNPVEALRYE